MDLRSAVPFGNWKEGELASLSGKFFGNGTGTASNYQVRINLLETIDTSNLSPSSCVGFYNNSQVVFKESVEGGRIKILRTPTFGYIILVVSNNFYVQLFQTRENGRRQIEVHITKEENKRPVVMKAKQIRNSYADDCGLYY